jgi:hypothetical protein
MYLRHLNLFSPPLNPNGSQKVGSGLISTLTAKKKNNKTDSNALRKTLIPIEDLFIYPGDLTVPTELEF